MAGLPSTRLGAVGLAATSCLPPALLGSSDVTLVDVDPLAVEVGDEGLPERRTIGKDVGPRWFGQTFGEKIGQMFVRPRSQTGSSICATVGFAVRVGVLGQARPTRVLVISVQKVTRNRTSYHLSKGKVIGGAVTPPAGSNRQRVVQQ
jgi:hypothetical protein